MIKEGIEPKESTIACVLNACNFSRLTEEALKIFHSMESRFSIKPNSKHCSCIVEILCKAGRLEDAENFITTTMRQYSQEPSVSIWKMLLDACNTHSDLERAERISQIIMNLNSHN
jgi:pentatricopeptide repeat protein